MDSISDKGDPRKPRFAQVNRNFANYPLARDSRLRPPRWRRSETTGRWSCKLAGKDLIQLRLPADAGDDLKRFPTAFDVAVLWALISEAQITKSADIEFNSGAAVLRAAGLPANARTYPKLRSALDLWSELSLRFDCWYDPHRVRITKRGSKKSPMEDEGTIGHGPGRRHLLPPPIEAADGMRLTISKQWLGTSYHVRMPFPLPLRAATQNLVLWLVSWLGRARYRGDDAVRGITQAKTRRQLCHVIGLNHKTRNRALQRAITEAKKWFGQTGSSLGYVEHNGKMTFYTETIQDERVKMKRKLGTIGGWD